MQQLVILCHKLTLKQNLNLEHVENHEFLKESINIKQWNDLPKSFDRNYLILCNFASERKN